MAPTAGRRDRAADVTRIVRSIARASIGYDPWMIEHRRCVYATRRWSALH
jgi:hypothetical protein